MSGISVMLGCAARRLLQRLLHRPAGGVVDMDDAAVAVPALAGQVPALAVRRRLNGTPSSASRSIARGRVLDDELDRARGC